MKKKFSCVLFLTFSLFIVTPLAIALPPHAPPNESSNHVDASSDRGISVTSALFYLYNNLIEQGFLNENQLTRPNDIWSRDFSNFLNAIHEFDSTKGGYITKERLYRSDSNPIVYYGGDDENDLYLNFTNPSQTIYLGRRYGIPPNDCEAVSVDQHTENLAVAIAGNVQCFYFQHLSEFYQSLDAPRPLFNYELIRDQSGVEFLLKQYLDSLVAASLVDNYIIDLEDESASVEVFSGASGRRDATVPLTPTLVNLHSPQEESAASEELLHEMSTNSFIYIDSVSTKLSVVLLLETLESAIQAIMNLGGLASAGEKKSAFLSIYGLDDNNFEATSNQRSGEQNASTLCKRLSGNSYDATVVTPVNKCVTLYTGFDRGGLLTRVFPNGQVGNGLQAFASRLSSGYGYKLKSLAQGMAGIDIYDVLVALKNAQTLLLNMHGQNSSSFDLMCLDVEYGTRAACEQIKSIARGLGVDVSTMDCNTANPPMSDPSELVTGFSSGNADGCVNGRPPFNRLWIRLTPSNGLYNGIGVKAAVITSQCYGGANCGSTQYLSNVVMDYFSGLVADVNFARPLQHDFKLLGDDLLGSSKKYLNCVQEPPQNPSSPFCVEPPHDLVYRVSHTISGSQGARGTNNLSEDQHICIPAYSPFDGTESYCVANISGDSETSVEFAPTVALLSYHQEDHMIAGLFSSAVQSDVGQITFDDTSCRPRLSTDVNYHAWSIGSSDFFVGLGGWPLMPDRDWGDSDRLQESYGFNASSWKWFLKIKISGVRAPNGVALDGNGSAAQKIIWPNSDGPSVVAPWSNLSGVAPNGDPFEVWLPCEPPIQCCYPNIELNDDGSGVVVNGCTCGTSSSIRTDPGSDIINPIGGCYSLNPFWKQDGTGMGNRYYSGTPRINASCCDGVVCDQYESSFHDCPQFEGCAFIPPAEDKTYLFREWSMDQHGDAQCQTVVGQCGDCVVR